MSELEKAFSQEIEKPARRSLRPRTVALARTMKEYIGDLGITQQQIADELDRSQTYVSAQLRGQSAIDYETMCAIADLAGVTPDYLFGMAHARVQAILDSQARSGRS